MQDTAALNALTRRFVDRLRLRIPASSLVVFRIGFGLLMCWSFLREASANPLLQPEQRPDFFFRYPGFEWLPVWPGEGLRWHAVAVAVAALGMAIGLFYIVAAIAFFVGSTYLFVLDQSLYNNHNYLICILGGFFCLTPLHQKFSIDAWLGFTAREDKVATWTLWLFRWQIGLVYFFGGIAKIDAEWLTGTPMRIWLESLKRSSPNLDWIASNAVIQFFAVGGLLFDLLVVPGLLWRKSRTLFVVGSIAFHLMNSRVFEIGVFPWLMLLATSLFFDPDWPDALFLRMTGASRGSARASIVADVKEFSGRRRTALVACILAVHCPMQALLPLRHWLYPGDASWTEEGHQFAWRMMLRDKVGDCRFYVTDVARNSTWEIDPSRHLTSRQSRMLSVKPRMIEQFARWIAERHGQRLGRTVEVRALAVASLNGRAPQLLVDPHRDLARVGPYLLPADWIVSLGQSIPQSVGIGGKSVRVAWSYEVNNQTTFRSD